MGIMDRFNIDFIIVRDGVVFNVEYHAINRIPYTAQMRYLGHGTQGHNLTDLIAMMDDLIECVGEKKIKEAQDSVDFAREILDNAHNTEKT